MKLTQDQLDAFHRDGYIMVEDVFDPEEMSAALRDMEKIFYGNSFAEFLAEFDRTGKADSVEPSATHSVTHYGDTPYGRTQFPTGYDALDRLIENEDYLDIYADCLGTDDISYCNAHLFMRAGPSDQRHSEHLWQGYHADHGTNTFLPPSYAVGSFDYVNSGVYLHDVDEDGAPMHVIPGSHRTSRRRSCPLGRGNKRHSRRSRICRAGTDDGQSGQRSIVILIPDSRRRTVHEQTETTCVLDAVIGSRGHRPLDETGKSMAWSRTAILWTVLGKDDTSCPHTLRLAPTRSRLLH